jgi:hypothetical protein
MFNKKHSLLAVSGLVIVSALFVPLTSASPTNNPIFTTASQVLDLIQNAMLPFEERLGIVEDKTENLEIWAEGISSQPPCATCTAEIATKVVNESSAVDSLQSIVLAMEKFKLEDLENDQEFDYADSITELFDRGRLIDNVLAAGKKLGYEFLFEKDLNNDLWSVRANPITPGKSGDRYFYVDESGVIRFNASSSATPNDEPIGG